MGGNTGAGRFENRNIVADFVVVRVTDWPSLVNEDAVEVSKQVVDVIDVRESCWRDVGSLPARELA